MWLPMNPAPPVTTAMDFTTGPSCRLELFQPPHVEVSGVLHAVRQLVVLEGLAKVADGVLDVVLRPETEHARDLVGVHVVGAEVGGGRCDDGNVAFVRKLF